MANKQGFSTLEGLPALVNSKDWAEFVNLLNQRKGYLQYQVNRYVREQSLILAYGELCKLDDIEKLKEQVQIRLKEIKK
jgi:hypothetical protein